MNTVYVCGFEYDDFSDGGFAVFAVCDSENQAKRLIQQGQKEMPALPKSAFSYRTYKINSYQPERWD